MDNKWKEIVSDYKETRIVTTVYIDGYTDYNADSEGEVIATVVKDHSDKSIIVEYRNEDSKKDEYVQETIKEVSTRLKSIRPNKRVLVIKDRDDEVVLATLIIAENSNFARIKEDIRNVKNNLPGEWQISDILEGITEEYIELPSTVVYC